MTTEFSDNQSQLQRIYNICTIIYFKLSKLWYFAYTKPFLRLKQKSYEEKWCCFIPDFSKDEPTPEIRTNFTDKTAVAETSQKNLECKHVK